MGITFSSALLHKCERSQLVTALNSPHLYCLDAATAGHIIGNVLWKGSWYENMKAYITCDKIQPLIPTRDNHRIISWKFLRNSEWMPMRLSCWFGMNNTTRITEARAARRPHSWFIMKCGNNFANGMIFKMKANFYKSHNFTKFCNKSSKIPSFF